MDGFVTVNNGFQEPADAGEARHALRRRTRHVVVRPDRPAVSTTSSRTRTRFADHYHCSVPGPTWPNRMYLYLGHELRADDDDSVSPTSRVPVPRPTTRASSTSSRSATSAGELVLGRLSRRGRRVRARPLAQPLGTDADITGSSFAQFTKDAAKPATSRRSRSSTRTSSSESNGGAGTDEHPPGDIQSGEQFVARWCRP
jgi:hypothetical protein